MVLNISVILICFIRQFIIEIYIYKLGEASYFKNPPQVNYNFKSKGYMEIAINKIKVAKILYNYKNPFVCPSCLEVNVIFSALIKIEDFFCAVSSHI